MRWEARRGERGLRTGVVEWEEPHHPGPFRLSRGDCTPLSPTSQHISFHRPHSGVSARPSRPTCRRYALARMRRLALPSLVACVALLAAVLATGCGTSGNEN